MTQSYGFAHGHSAKQKPPKPVHFRSHKELSTRETLCGEDYTTPCAYFWIKIYFLWHQVRGHVPSAKSRIRPACSLRKIIESKVPCRQGSNETPRRRYGLIPMVAR